MWCSAPRCEGSGSGTLCPGSDRGRRLCGTRDGSCGSWNSPSSPASGRRLRHRPGAGGKCRVLESHQPVVMPPSSGDMGQRACEGGAPGVLTRSVERSRVPAGSVIDHEAPGEQDGRATSSAQSQRVLAQSQGVFGTRTDPVRVARPPPSRPLVPDLLGQHLVLVNGTKSFTIPDRADDSNPNMLCVTTARLRVLAHVPSSSAYLPMPHRALPTCPCPIELCEVVVLDSDINHFAELGGGAGGWCWGRCSAGALGVSPATSGSAGAGPARFPRARPRRSGACSSMPAGSLGK